MWESCCGGAQANQLNISVWRFNDLKTLIMVQRSLDLPLEVVYSIGKICDRNVIWYDLPAHSRLWKGSLKGWGLKRVADLSGSCPILLLIALEWAVLLRCRFLSWLPSNPLRTWRAHTTLSLPLFQAAGAKLLSHWAWLKAEALERPSSKCWQAWRLERRD